MNQGYYEYQNARQQADAFAVNGMKAEAVESYERAIELLPNSGMSEQQQKLIGPILARRLERVRAS